MRTSWRVYFILIGACLLTTSKLYAQKIDAAAHQSIVEAFQLQVKNHTSVFPLGSMEGKVQSIPDGLRNVYFGYGERRYSDRTDFHPAMDMGYFPLETGDVTTAYGKTRKVRAPKSYMKRIFAIQNGLLVSAAKNSSGYKIILKHTLKKPYYDSEGRAYHEYFTSYRHVDVRSLAYLTKVARVVTKNEKATYEDIVGKQVFRAGDLIAFVGYDPNVKSTLPRSHLDFSLHVFPDPHKGTNIRKYSVNPLLIFPAFEYGDPQSHQIEDSGVPAYQFVIDQKTIVPPSKRKDGHFQIEIHAGGLSADGAYSATRYFALNAMHVTVINDGKELAKFTLDRHQKLGYDTSSYEGLDNPNDDLPYFDPPMDEQGDVFLMDVVLPKRWFKDIDYDWKKDGSVSIKVSSIWDGSLDGHHLSIDIPLTRK
jgi:hypothetical protein